MRSGFTIIRNGNTLGYPYLESLRSLAPLVDEIVVAVGDSHDGTHDSLDALAAQLPCPLRLIDSPWDPESQRGGFELARQTNIALEACKFEVCLYLQADELFNESEFAGIRQDLERFAEDNSIDALAFQWVHFYGNFETIVESKQWYRREIRAVKRSRGLRSFGDAQGFRIPGERDGAWTKPRAALSAMHVYHYGWVRPPAVMAQKSEVLDRLWHGHARDGQHTADSIYKKQFGLRPFRGTHPASMQTRVRELAGFDPFTAQRIKKDLRYWRLAFTAWLEGWSGWRPGEFKNYRSLKRYF